MWHNIPKNDNSVHKRNSSASGSQPQIIRSDMSNRYECLTDEPIQPEQGAQSSPSPIESKNVPD